MDMMEILVTQMIDRVIDDINAFHRDEAKPQRAQARGILKSDVDLAERLRLGAELDPNFVADKAREWAREYLLDQYEAGAVEKRLA
jgi:hypothetical protein